MMHTFIGTSGWNYDHWRGPFYPQGYPKAKWLDYYIKVFETVEVNATFYRQLRADTFDKWRIVTPEDFVFSIKANRYITHIKRLKEIDDTLAILFSSAHLLQRKLGPVLFQLPPSLTFDASLLEDFLSLLPAGHRYTIEARHKSWVSDNTLSALAGHNIAWCIADTAGRYPYLEAVTADFVYLRLHGSKKLYASEYTAHELNQWADKIRTWGHDAYVYFDNDYMGYAPKNALELKKLLG